MGLPCYPRGNYRNTQWRYTGVESLEGSAKSKTDMRALAVAEFALFMNLVGNLAS